MKLFFQMSWHNGLPTALPKQKAKECTERQPCGVPLGQMRRMQGLNQCKRCPCRKMNANSKHAICLNEELGVPTALPKQRAMECTERQPQGVTPPQRRVSMTNERSARTGKRSKKHMRIPSQVQARNWEMLRRRSA